MEARESAADYLARYGVQRDPREEIIITCGGMGAVFAALQCLVDPGSEVLIQDPQWVNYAAQIRLAGGVPVRVPVYEERDFRLQPEELERRITDRTKLLILNSPNNPTGMVLTEEELGNAYAAAACPAAGAQETMFSCSTVIFRMISLGPAAKPTRHPVMAKVLEVLLTITVRSAISGGIAGLINGFFGGGGGMLLVRRPASVRRRRGPRQRCRECSGGREEEFHRPEAQ